ncbi:MAG: DUF5717 family protein [Eubacteriales bacterium]|nr:DUF5717 family protein [Eubacteriales bacterium]
MIQKEKIYIERDINGPVFGDFWLRDVTGTRGRIRAEHPGFIFKATLYKDAMKVDYHYKLPLHRACDMKGVFTIITDKEDIIVPYHFRFTDHAVDIPDVYKEKERVTPDNFKLPAFGEQFPDDSRERILWEAYIAKPVRPEDIREFFIAVGAEKRQKPVPTVEEKRIILHDAPTMIYVRVQRAVFRWLADKTERQAVSEALADCIQELRGMNETPFRIKILEYVWSLVNEDEYRKTAVFQTIAPHADTEDAPFYALYRYFKLLQRPEKEDVTAVVAALSTVATDTGMDVFLWLSHLARRLNNPVAQANYKELKRDIMAGSCSPFMYLDVLHFIDRYDTAILQMDHVDIKVLYWAYRKGLLPERILECITAQAASVSAYHPQLVKILSAEYEREPASHVLQAICTLLIRGNRTDEDAFHRYLAGIREKLRITGLYEHCLSAMPFRYDALLPEALYHYFKNARMLAGRSMQSLYANIVVNKAIIGEIYKATRAESEAYALQSLRNRRINENLVILYDDMDLRARMDKALSHCLLNIYCAFRFRCLRDDVESLTVVQERLANIIDVPLQNGVGEARIPDASFHIIMEMKDGRRVVARREDVAYERLMRRTTDVELALHVGSTHIVALMEEEAPDAETLRILNGKRWLRGHFQRKLQTALYQRYVTAGTLEEHLDEFQLKFVGDKRGLIEAYIRTGRFRQALQGMIREGFDIINPTMQLRLLYGMLAEKAAVTDLMRDIAYHLFRNGVHENELILFLYEDFELTIGEQIEFYEILQEHLTVDECFSDKLERYCIYLLRQNGEFAEDKLYEILRMRREDCRPMEMLELMRYYSVQRTLSAEERSFLVPALASMVRAHIYPEWMMRFKRHGILPFELADKVIMTFKAPGYISYRYVSSTSRRFRELRLNKITDGMYVVAISMFYGDCIEFSLLDEQHRATTDVYVYKFDKPVIPGEPRDGYDRLNEIIYARMNDMDSLGSRVAAFRSLEDMAETVFKPEM